METTDSKQQKPRGGGPKTPEGRKRSSLNSLRHGVLSRTLVLPNESQEEFDHFRGLYLETFQPVGFLELELVDEMVACRWRQRRGWAVESASITLEMTEQLDELREAFLQIDGATRIALAFQALDNGSPKLDLLHRYDTRLHRMYHRTLKQLLEIQEKRRRDGSPVNTDLSDPLPPNDEKLRNELDPQRYELAPDEVMASVPLPAPAVGALRPSLPLRFVPRKRRLAARAQQPSASLPVQQSLNTTAA